MIVRLPKANVWFDKQTDATLATYAQAIHDGLAASVTDFPTPPITLLQLQSDINSYVTALTLASGPGAGKVNTANKNSKKQILQYDLRLNCQYVNQTIFGAASGGATYAALQTMVLETGYQLSKDPTPAGPLSAPELVKYGSFNKGQFYILTKKVVNAKGYVVKVDDSTTPSNPTQYFSFPSSRITILNLLSGNRYNFSVAAIGTNPVRNFSTEISDAVII